MSRQIAMLRVFLCHSSGDKPAVRELYRRLLGERVAPWLDEENLLPGQDWEREIKREIHRTDVVIVCFSRSSTTKSGYIQKEIRIVLDEAERKPEGTIFVIPARLEDCVVPDRLAQWQRVDLCKDHEYEKLLRVLRKQAERLESADVSSTAPDTDVRPVPQSQPAPTQYKVGPVGGDGIKVASTPDKRLRLLMIVGLLLVLLIVGALVVFVARGKPLNGSHAQPSGDKPIEGATSVTSSVDIGQVVATGGRSVTVGGGEDRHRRRCRCRERGLGQRKWHYSFLSRISLGRS